MPEHPAIDSLGRYKPPSTFDLIKRGAEETPKALRKGWDWATTPLQPATEGAGFVENTLAGMTSPAGIAEAIFPGVGFVKRPMKAAWKGREQAATRTAMDRLESVAKSLGPKEQELMQQTELIADPRLSAKGVYNHPDEMYAPLDVRDLPDYYNRLNEGEAPPGFATIDPYIQDDELLAQILRHELRHSDQFMNQMQNFREGKSIMTPYNLYGASESPAAFPNTPPHFLGEDWSRGDRYMLNPFEVDARAHQPDIPNPVGALAVKEHPGGLPIEIIGAAAAPAEHGGNPILEAKIKDLTDLTSDVGRLSPYLPEDYLERVGKDLGGASPDAMEDLKYQTTMAKAMQQRDVRNAIVSLLSSLGLK